MSISRQISVGALLVGVAACSDSTSPNNKTGNLTVTVTSASAVTPRVTVTGPAGYQKTIASTTQLTGLTPGSYTISALAVTTTDSIVGAAYTGTVTGTPGTVTAGGSASATVAYTTRPGSGELWVVGGTFLSNSVQNGAIAYTESRLHNSTALAPTLSFDFPVTAGTNIDANAVAIDPQGDLWVVNDNSNTVVEYTPSVLSTGGSPTPAVTIHLLAAYTDGLAFDAKGDLWVVNQDSSRVVEFTPDQLKTSGSPTPAITITVKTIAAGISGQPVEPGIPLAITFDANGNLWVVSALGTILEYTPSQIGSSGTPTPAVTLSPRIMYPYYAAFDKTGNLWLAASEYLNVVVNNGVTVDSTWIPGYIAELAASTLTSSGSPSPTLKLTVPHVGPYAANPTALAFDDNGDLWYTESSNNMIGEFTAAQITAGGNPSPAVSMLNTPLTGTGLAFDPHSTALPLH